MAFSHVSRTIKTVTGKTFARKFITLGKVINYWADAVGPELAAKSYPIGMSVRKNVKKNKTTISDRDLIATLEIAATSADATLLHYQKALILERLAVLLGADMIVDLKIVHNGQTALSSSALTHNESTLLTKSSKTCLSHVTKDIDNVTDDELRAVLERIGHHIETKSKVH